LGASAIPVVLTFLLVFVAWRMVFSFNKDLVRVRAWGELARRALPFVTITVMALSLPLVQKTLQEEWAPLIWALAFGVALIISNFLSTPISERQANRAFRNRDYTTAAELYRKLAEEQPLPRYWAFLGTALGARKQPEEGIKASTRAIELDPQYGLAYYNRALILRSMGRKSRAAEDLNRALDVDLPRRFRSSARNILEEL
jgi:tetratricopeptide (TPR) repeat protein